VSGDPLSALESRLAQLPPEKRALFEKMLREKSAGKAEQKPEGAGEGTGGEAPVPLRREGDESGTFPLSFAQERLWFLDRMDPGNTAFNITGGVALDGELHAGALRSALAEVARRHATLRTTFQAEGGRPVQVIAPPAPVPLPTVELAGLPERRREAELRRVADGVVGRGFDLARGPLLRTVLVRLARRRHALFFALHHTVADGWSNAILVRELGTLYAAILDGRRSPLPEPPVRYVDFARWQRRWLAGAELERQLDYWRGQLTGPPVPVLELPTDRPRGGFADRRPEGIVRGRLPEARVAPLRELARNRGGTLFMTLLAGLGALLGRTAGQRDVAVGTVIANRNRRELEGLIGLFANTLVMRLDCSVGEDGIGKDGIGEDGERARPGFGTLMERAREAAFGAYAHQDMPFEKLVAELRPERRLDVTPFFQVMMVLQNQPSEVLRLPGLELRNVEVERPEAKFDLTFSLMESGGGLAAEIEYDRGLYDATTVLRLWHHLAALLAAGADDPETPVDELPILAPGERHQLLREWSDTATPYPRRSLAGLFAEVAAARPEAVAVVAEGGVEDGGVHHLSYRELESRAGRLARRLAAAGAAPGTLVGLCLDRSPELVTATLAALRAGAAYLPLDPSYPRERLAFMLEDARSPVVVVGDGLEEALPAPLPGGATLLRPDAGGGELPADTPLPDPGPRSLAYVMYTSGSTGRPKGVAVEQRGVVRLVCAADYAELGPEETVLHVAPISFDAATFEIWAPLLNGGRLVLAPPGRLSLEELAAAGERQRVTTCLFTAALFHQMAEGPVARLGNVRQLLAGGDVLSPARVAASTSALPGAAVINVYGPTENTTITTSWRMHHPEEVADPVPIGRPIGSTGVRILDRSLRPVAIGVVGQLCAAGDGLARGYLRRPALTAERFVPEPYGGAGERLYLTGDLARHRADGRIDFLGRGDQQVKIRGFRIEPGEVAAALEEEPEVASAAVVVHGEGSAAGKRLAAFAVAAGEEPVPSELLDRLRRRLPAYLVPPTLTFLDALPLTAVGKVDRAALRTAARGAAGKATTAHRPPRNRGEERLAEIWAEVLGDEAPGMGAVGIDDDFFELGGHSLLATRLVSSVREAFGVELPLREVFEAPTVASMAARIAERTPEAGPAGVAWEEEGPVSFPLSFAQERLWFLDRMDPGNSAYNIAGGVALDGELEVGVLRDALAEVARRHATLRTTFRVEEGRPVQVIAPPAPVPLPIAELAGLPEHRQRAALDRIAGSVVARGFDLARGPLLRAVLARLGERRHALFFALHHTVADGWSHGLLVRELGSLYAATLEGRPSPLPELPVRYVDFARWQRRWLAGDELERQLDYWRRQLTGPPVPVLELPTDRPRRAGRGRRPAGVLRQRLPAERAAALRELTRRRGGTLFMTLLAGLAAVLGRTAGERDVAVGSVIANRNRQEIEGLIGLFANTLVMRLDLRGAPGGRPPGFGALVDQAREVAFGAYAHQDLPFEKLVAELRPERRLDATPFFQVMLAFLNLPSEVLRLPGLELRALDAERSEAKFDLTLSLVEEGGGITAGIEYDRGLYDATTIVRLWRHLDAFFAAGVADPEKPVDELPILVPAERHQLLREWSDTETPYPRRSLAELFAGVAAERPDTVAVVAAGHAGDGYVGDGGGEELAHHLSYRELRSRAGRLARRLAAAGAAPGTLVGLAVDRSPELVTATLAVLRAGAAYLPLDPSYPAERLAFMLEDARSPVVVAGRGLEDALPRPLPGGATLLRPDDGGGHPEDAALPSAGPTSLAYAMYTSGSTGRPKGVAVEQRSVVRLVREANFAEMGPDESFLHLAPTSFDASTLELWAPLLNGGRLVLAPPGRLSLEELAAVIARQRVTACWLTAGLFHQVVEGPIAGLRGVRQLLAGGDVLSPAKVAAALEALPGAAVINGYGPTENTTFTTTWRMTRPAAVADPVPIGRPISATAVRILDRSLRPVAIGVVGQLCAAGAGLARGYLRRPAMTAERFVPDPFGVAGERLYLTGDLARHRSDGRIDFLGRGDQQVKIRGFRIELGEVEEALGEEPEVATAAAVAHGEGSPAGKRLAAFAVAAGEAEPVASELLERLRGRLPGYLVPATLTFLDALPLTANGKVDRAALARRADDAGPATAREAEPGTPTPLRTATEEILAALWSELLEVGPVGADDDFFELGGHSLLATRATSRIREAFGVEVSLRRFFETPTVAGVAAAVDDALATAEPGAEPAPPIVPGDDPELPPGEAPLSFAQERLWILDRFEPGNPAYHMPFSVRLRGRLEPAALASALVALVARHGVLRTTFHSRDGRPVQRLHRHLPTPLPVVDLARLDDPIRRRELRRIDREDPRHPFDLERGPLLRCRLLRLAGDDHVLAMNVHHVACDGWSAGILIRELGLLYGAVVEGGARPELPPLPVSYADYARWQRGWLQGATLDRQVAYWRRLLEGVPEALELPTDRPRPAVRTFDGGSGLRILPAELSERLRETSHRSGATLFMTLLAGFEVLLARLSGQRDFAVGTPIAGRTRAEVENLVGIFLNTLVLRSALAPDGDGASEESEDESGAGHLSFEPLSFEEVVARVRRGALDAYAHQDLPFEKLLDEIQPDRDLSRTPLFQVFFNMVNLPLEPMQLAGLTIEPVEEPELAAKFDLTLYVAEGGDGRIGFSAVYNRLLFTPERIEEMLRQYQQVLERVAGDPAVPIRELDLRTEAAEPILPHPADPLDDTFRGSVVELFHQRADEHPDRIAVADPHGAWSYAELRRRASRIARRLADAGLEPGEVVAILAQRSAALVAAVYGTLEAGGAFLLMDPAYPGPRLAEIVEAARPTAFLALADPPPELDAAVANERTRLRLALPPWGAPAGGGDPTADGPGLDAPVEVTADHLAYLSFTSGSTGKPKGIEGRHGPLTHFLPWQCQRFDLGESDRYSMLSGLAHDPLQRDLFTPLTTGGSLHLPDPARIFAAGYLASWLAAERVTVAHLTPAMAQIVTEATAAGETPPRVPSLRRAFLTGEALTWRDVTRMRRLAPGIVCVNFYGSTETQRAVGYCEATAVDVDEGSGHDGKEILPLGRGMEDVQLLVVNPEGRLAGVGELGEVWVRSPHLARGYLGDPELTADRFLRNPWGDDPADRVYRTGDLGRYLPDGRVAFAGRVDFQVQIRGYRVEPGEVEAALARIEGVREAVVLVRGEGRETRRLVAYLAREAGKAGRALDVEGVRRVLRAELPAYMVPEGYLLLDRLPLTPNGKVDRAALREMKEESAARGGYRAPETELERSLVELLKELLERDRVGVEDNFFDLGANSLLLVRFHGHLQELLGREIAAVELFNHPTVRSLVAHLGGTAEEEPRPVADRGDQLKSGRDRLRRLKGRRRT